MLIQSTFSSRTKPGITFKSSVPSLKNEQELEAYADTLNQQVDQLHLKNIRRVGGFTQSGFIDHMFINSDVTFPNQSAARVQIHEIMPNAVHTGYLIQPHLSIKAYDYTHNDPNLPEPDQFVEVTNTADHPPIAFTTRIPRIVEKVMAFFNAVEKRINPPEVLPKP